MVANSTGVFNFFFSLVCLDLSSFFKAGAQLGQVCLEGKTDIHVLLCMSQE